MPFKGKVVVNKMKNQVSLEELRIVGKITTYMVISSNF